MKPFTVKKMFIGPALVVILLAATLLSATGCEELGYPPAATAPAEEEAETKATAPLAVSRSKDSAILAVYRHLLGQAESYQAKVYLSDFYASCDNWSATSEYFKDGSATWCVTVDMTASQDWTQLAYWQQASWFVFKDGSVIPANLLEANALRIEADLQQLSRDDDKEEADAGENKGQPGE